MSTPDFTSTDRIKSPVAVASFSATKSLKSRKYTCRGTGLDSARLLVSLSPNDSAKNHDFQSRKTRCWRRNHEWLVRAALVWRWLRMLHPYMRSALYPIFSAPKYKVKHFQRWGQTTPYINYILRSPCVVRHVTWVSGGHWDLGYNLGIMAFIHAWVRKKHNCWLTAWDGSSAVAAHRARHLSCMVRCFELLRFAHRRLFELNSHIPHPQFPDSRTMAYTHGLHPQSVTLSCFNVSRSTFYDVLNTRIRRDPQKPMESSC